MNATMNNIEKIERARRTRRVPTAPYQMTSPHTTYGTSYYNGTSEEDGLLHSASKYCDEEGGFPVLQSYAHQRRYRTSGPWYRQTQKIILIGVLEWVGTVLYLSSLAHSILQSHTQISHTNMMGSSSSSSTTSSKKATDDDIRKWLDNHNTNSYGAANTNDEINDEDFNKWLETQINNRYGRAHASSSSTSSSGSNEGDAWNDWVETVKSEGRYSSTNNQKHSANTPSENAKPQALFPSNSGSSIITSTADDNARLLIEQSANTPSENAKPHARSGITTSTADDNTRLLDVIKSQYDKIEKLERMMQMQTNNNRYNV